MRRPACYGFASVVIGLAANIASAESVTVVDGDFVDWSFDATADAGTSATVTRESTGGSPGARLNVTTLTGLGTTAFGVAVKDDFATSAALEGTSVGLSIDVLSGAGGFGEGQGILLAVSQDDSVYVRGLGITGFPLNFDTVAFTSSFDASSFTRVLGLGAATPDFGGGVETRFGFAAGNTNSATLTQYYDNFRLTLDLPDEGGPVIPTPNAAALGLTVLSGALMRRRSHA